jgi:hypothetical protein
MTPLQIANQHEEYATRNIQEPSVTGTTPFDPQTTAAGVLAWADLGGLNRRRADAETKVDLVDGSGCRDYVKYF